MVMRQLLAAEAPLQAQLPRHRESSIMPSGATGSHSGFVMHSAPVRYRSLGLCSTEASVFSLGGWLTFGPQVADERAGRALIARCANRQDTDSFFRVALSFGGCGERKCS